MEADLREPVFFFVCKNQDHCGTHSLKLASDRWAHTVLLAAVEPYTSRPARARLILQRVNWTIAVQT